MKFKRASIYRSFLHVHSFLSLFNHRVLINLTSISIHLCINKNHELCCGYRVQFFHELLLVSFIHIHVQYKSNSSLFFVSFKLQQKRSKICCEMLLKFIKIHRSWAMIIYCVKVFAAYKARKFRETFSKSLLKVPYRRRRAAHTQIDQSCMKLQNLNGLIRSYWINLIIVWNGIQWEPIFFIGLLALFHSLVSGLKRINELKSA